MNSNNVNEQSGSPRNSRNPGNMSGMSIGSQVPNPVAKQIQTTLDLYADEDLGEMIAAQEKFLDAVGFDAGSVQ